MKKFAILAVLAIAASAHAAVTITQDVQVAAGVSGDGTVVDIITIKAVSDIPGDLVNALEGQLIVDPALCGDSALNQVWPFGALPSPESVTAVGPADPLDTHILLSTAALLVGGAAPAEDNDLSQPAIVGNGWGTFLNFGAVASSAGTEALDPADASGQTVLLVQAVVPTLTKVKGTILVATPATGITQVEDCFGVPEPATMSLLVLGGLIAIRRRK